MINLTHTKLALILILGTAGTTLTACNGGGDGVTLPTPPPPPPPTLQEQFGAKFAQSFNKSMNDVPVDPMQGDIIMIDITADPLDVPDP